MGEKKKKSFCYEFPRPSLTVNYGVRWDWYGAVTDVAGRIRNLSFADGDLRSVGGQTAPTLVPKPGLVTALYDINWKQFMPRLGVVYRFTDRTVLRLGSGLFYSPQQTNNFNILGLNPPYSGSTGYYASSASRNAVVAGCPSA